MTYINEELLIRRHLAEKIKFLECQLSDEKEKVKALETTVSEYNKKCDTEEQRFIDLVENVTYVASQIPRDHRRRIMDVLPVL